MIIGILGIIIGVLVLGAGIYYLINARKTTPRKFTE